MSLHIFIHRSSPAPLQANELVTGYVEVHCKRAEQKDLVRQVLLKFYGRSKVQIIRTQHRQAGQRQRTQTLRFHSKALLCSQYHRLDNPSFSPPASRRGEDGGILTFPFSFRIPTHAEPQDPATTEAHRANVFTPRDCFPGSVGYDPPGRVPPPVPLPDSIPELTAHYDYQVKVQASIRYTLHVECPELKAGASRLWMGSVDESVDLDIINPATLAPHAVQWMSLSFEDTIRTFNLFPEDQRPKLGFRDRMSSVFKKDRLPWCAFHLALQAPSTLWLDGPNDAPLPLHLLVRRVASGAGASAERRKSDASSQQQQPSSTDGSSYTSKGQEKLSPSTNPTAPNDPSILTPPLHITSFTLRVSYNMALRGAEASPSSWGGRTYELTDHANVCDWAAGKKQPRVEVPLSDHEDRWLDLGRELGITYGHMKAAAANDARFGGLQGDFATPNLARRFGLEWCLKVEGLDE